MPPRRRNRSRGQNVARHLQRNQLDPNLLAHLHQLLFDPDVLPRGPPVIHTDELVDRRLNDILKAASSHPNTPAFVTSPNTPDIGPDVPHRRSTFPGCLLDNGETSKKSQIGFHIPMCARCKLDLFPSSHPAYPSPFLQHPTEDVVEEDGFEVDTDGVITITETTEQATSAVPCANPPQERVEGAWMTTDCGHCFCHACAEFLTPGRARQSAARKSRVVIVHKPCPVCQRVIKTPLIKLHLNVP